MDRIYTTVIQTGRFYERITQVHQTNRGQRTKCIGIGGTQSAEVDKQQQEPRK